MRKIFSAALCILMVFVFTFVTFTVSADSVSDPNIIKWEDHFEHGGYMYTKIDQTSIITSGSSVQWQDADLGLNDWSFYDHRTLQGIDFEAWRSIGNVHNTTESASIYFRPRESKMDLVRQGMDNLVLRVYLYVYAQNTTDFSHVEMRPASIGLQTNNNSGWTLKAITNYSRAVRRDDEQGRRFYGFDIPIDQSWMTDTVHYLQSIVFNYDCEFRGASTNFYIGVSAVRLFKLTLPADPANEIYPGYTEQQKSMNKFNSAEDSLNTQNQAGLDNASNQMSSVLGNGSSPGSIAQYASGLSAWKSCIDELVGVTIPDFSFLLILSGSLGVFGLLLGLFADGVRAHSRVQSRNRRNGG